MHVHPNHVHAETSKRTSWVSTVNWVLNISLVQPTTTIKLTKMFNTVNLGYKITQSCAHKESHFELLSTLFTASPHSKCQFKAKGGLLNREGSMSSCLLMQAITLAKKAVKKDIVNKDLGKK